ncbi:GNAT family N-acetyltransferase [Bradyrhizobium sp. NAS80.1]|uniref:GNAT family N-acetyltransferase n=1 Tax=Bradyrhizobium sp. NAS80.1 TaxID=1680159 RepID=UPI000A06B8F7|nr:GNAT family N-acetyltransferase [Bradyrhizobium sp. NAS80.1]
MSTKALFQAERRDNQDGRHNGSAGEYMIGSGTMNIRIEHLKNLERFIPTIAAWQHEEFGYLTPEVTLEQRIVRLTSAKDPNRLPVALVALSEDDKTLLGTASILVTTLIHKNLSPWLSSVYVPPAHRGNGVASALATAAASETERLGFSTLYLFTPNNESLYSRLGWTTFDRTFLKDTPLTVMARKAQK